MKTVIESLILGSVSSASTTIIYQPLELLKTRIQIESNHPKRHDRINRSTFNVIGRATRSAIKLTQDNNILYLWRGTGASLLRSVPGIGVYYASLNILQTNLSAHGHQPDSPTQAFFFGLTSRSMVSLLLLPITVVKVRYESGLYKYPSLSRALKEAYLKNGWVGVAPTILRDSLFSGIYYMCYTELKSYNFEYDYQTKANNDGVEIIAKPKHFVNFASGIISGLVASIITNPIDVLKTNIQVDGTKYKSMRQTAINMLREKGGYIRFFDGLMPRSLRRTLIAASTWTFYEYLMDKKF